ncbi:V-type ATP synthase subunit I [Clostridium aestuarii]|uniref:V-type ATP synthase subunit I n=1 Tax=Clostridium aestuarii TaxID=338193 RepID=A0ABT4D095_9CLOT|nr:V-type ATP synthase subunit I [Clostridium aestuarii]MCY6484659.1 V-type ATP synthase subunit I [Clostridium aestuarii]
MAIVKMNKFTLFAFANQKESLLKNLQQFEGVQFVDLQTKLEDEELTFLKSAVDDKKILQNENELSKIKFSLDFLKPYREKESGIAALKKGKRIITFDELEKQIKNIDWLSIYEELKQKEEKQNSLSNEKTKIEAEIKSLSPWVNFNCSFEQLKNLKYTSYFLGIIPSKLKEVFSKEFQAELDYSYLEFINQGKDETYILAIVTKELENKSVEMLKKYGFTKVSFKYNESPINIIKNYENRIKEIEEEKNKIVRQLKKLKDYEEKLQLAYEYYSNKLERTKVNKNFIKTSNIVVIEGWTTLDSNIELEDIIKNTAGNDYYLEFAEPQDSDDVPILLKNNSFVEPFESVTRMYSLPNYREIDPTPIMSIFYVVFFGMMLSDAAYGIILVLGTLFALKKFPLEKGMKNFMKLFCYLGISTTVWGVIYGGWFGDAPKKLFNIQPKYLLSPSEGIMTVLKLAVVLGVIHIFVGLGMKAYILIREKKYLDVIFDVGLWYISLIGIFMMLLKVGGSAGKVLMIIGFVGLVLTQGRDAKTIGGKIGGGIYGLYGITSYIGDIVSYSRLLALGLATGFIANAFNLMITLIPAGITRIIAGVIIFTIGHLFNLGINALGAYVHTSRLQYLEFFNKFYEGGGKPFTPFEATNKFVNVMEAEK